MSKYHSQKYLGHDSKKEANRAAELQLLERGGAIRNLRQQARFQLIPAQKDDKGKVIERAVAYIADFCYYDAKTGEYIVEDTKGFKTKDYIIKRKLMLWVYGIRIREV